MNNRFWTHEWPTHFFLRRLGHGPWSPYSEWTTMSDSSPTIDVTPAPSHDFASQPQDDVTPQPAEIVMTPPSDNREEISRLNHQKGGFLSHLSRFTRKQYQLMFDRGTVADVTSFVEKVRAQFVKLELNCLVLVNMNPSNKHLNFTAIIFTSFYFVLPNIFTQHGAVARWIPSPTISTCHTFHLRQCLIS